jgi:hypothetical protein
MQQRSSERVGGPRAIAAQRIYGKSAFTHNKIQAANLCQKNHSNQIAVKK